MELKDYRKFVNESSIKDKLNSLTVVVGYPHLDSEIELKGIESIYRFVHSQVKGWNNFDQLPNYFVFSKNHFENIRSTLLEMTSNFNEDSTRQLDSLWNHASSQLNLIHDRHRNFIFLYDSPETDFIIDIYSKKPNYTQGAIDYLVGQQLNLSNGRDYLTGVLFAYEFDNKADSEIHHRRNNEKISLGQIRTKYNEHIVEAEQHLNQYISDAKENLTNHFNTVDDLKKGKEKSFDDWFKNTEEEFDNFYSIAQKSITDNEDLYREKLRLEAPANYWHKRAKVLKKEGQKFLIWLILLVVFAANGLFILLFQIPDGMLLKVFDDKVIAIKWSIILVTMISLLAYGIKILARLTFSSYHLSRDAEEREQLTHFYLALKHDTSVTDNDRQLILQSLFSRSDTGLLKEDSSPTMPTGIVDKYVGK